MFITVSRVSRKSQEDISVLSDVSISVEIEMNQPSLCTFAFPTILDIDILVIYTMEKYLHDSYLSLREREREREIKVFEDDRFGKLLLQSLLIRTVISFLQWFLSASVLSN